MKRNPNSNCGNCPYWHDCNEGEPMVTSECRFDAPKLLPVQDRERLIDNQADGVWPNTFETDFCSHHPAFFQPEPKADPTQAMREFVIAWNRVWNQELPKQPRPEIPPCPNCKETIHPCSCMKNLCLMCGKPVGNITFTYCEECFDREPRP